MNPTLIYNNYHLQRRKIFQHNPRSNLYSTVDFTWRQSVSDKMSPRQLIEYKRQLERQEIGDRSNELIAKRLRKEVNLSEEGGRYKMIDRNKGDNSNRKSMDNRVMRDSLNQELENYVHMQKSQSLNKRQQRKGSGRLLNINQNQNNQHSNKQSQNTYKKYFDPQLQSITSRQSLTQSQLTSLTSKNNYLSTYLSKRLSKYLSPNSNNIHGSRQAGLYQLEKELQMFDKEKE